MPRVVNTREDASAAIIKQLTEPVKITTDGIEYTFIADNIAVICETMRDEISNDVAAADAQIQRPIISLGDYGYIKTVQSPPTSIGDGGLFTFNFLKYSALSDADINRALRIICGVYVDYIHAIIPLPAGAVVRSLIDGREMKITEAGFAPEMVSADIVSYFAGVAGIARYNGALAAEFLRGDAFKIRIKSQNRYMFTSVFNSSSSSSNDPTDVYTVPPHDVPGEKVDDCLCKYKYGPVYACYRDIGRRDTYNMRCSNCVAFYKNRTYAEIETGITLQMAADEYYNALPPTPAGIERAEILRDLIDGELINWRGKLCLRGKKWFYHPHLLWALARGIALEFPGYYWV